MYNEVTLETKSQPWKMKWRVGYMLPLNGSHHASCEKWMLLHVWNPGILAMTSHNNRRVHRKQHPLLYVTSDCAEAIALPHLTKIYRQDLTLCTSGGDKFLACLFLRDNTFYLWQFPCQRYIFNCCFVLEYKLLCV